MAIIIYILGYVFLVGAISMAVLAFIDIRFSDMKTIRDRSTAIQHIIESILCIVCLVVVFFVRLIGGYQCGVQYNHDRIGYEYSKVRPRDYSATIYHFLGSLEDAKSVKIKTKTYTSDEVEIAINDKYHRKVKIGGYIKSSSVVWLYNGRNYLLPGEKVEKKGLKGEVFYINGTSKSINIKKVSTTLSKDGKKAVVEVFDGVNKFKWNAEVKQ